MVETYEDYYKSLSLLRNKHFNLFQDYLKLTKNKREIIKDKVEKEITKLKKAGKCNDFITEAKIFCKLIKSEIENETNDYYSI